jgi:formate dehydrogenase iron-sulfur subunit
MAKSFFIDLTRCTACRGCQVACKQWHKLPAEETRNRGSHQNPPDLSYHTYKLVRFTETEQQGNLQWLFWPEQCRHCVEPPCMYQADYGDSIYIDEKTGAVIYTEKTRREDIENIRGSCPYDIPRVDKESGIISKCDMCNDRVHNGLLPACVQVCPTGAMNFGDREEMMEMAQKRLKTVKKRFPDAVLGDPDFTRAIFLYQFKPSLFYEYAVAGLTAPLTRNRALAKLAKPAKRILT